MDIGVFFKGIVIGFLVAGCIGPISALCIQLTLTKGKSHGVISGFGAATADAIYALAAGFGLSFISNFLLRYQQWFRFIGASLCCYLGIKIFFSKLTKGSIQENNSTYIGTYGTSFFLVLTNPATILSFVSIFTALGMMGTNASYLLAIGVFVGSGLWWIILSSITDVFVDKLDHSKLVWLNRILGIIITIFGLFILLSLML